MRKAKVNAEWETAPYEEAYIWWDGSGFVPQQFTVIPPARYLSEQDWRDRKPVPQFICVEDSEQ